MSKKIVIAASIISAFLLFYTQLITYADDYTEITVSDDVTDFVVTEETINGLVLGSEYRADFASIIDYTDPYTVVSNHSFVSGESHVITASSATYNPNDFSGTIMYHCPRYDSTVIYNDYSNSATVHTIYTDGSPEVLGDFALTDSEAIGSMTLASDLRDINNILDFVSNRVVATKSDIVTYSAPRESITYDYNHLLDENYISAVDFALDLSTHKINMTINYTYNPQGINSEVYEYSLESNI